jgi:hypothetical protein
MEVSMSALHLAELAWYVTGRFYVTATGVLADYGYFLHLGGIEGELFAGDRSESTAYFTFAAIPFTAHTVTNGALSLGIDTIGDFSVYLQRTPAGDFDDPLSFARGDCIGTFRRTSCVVGTTVNKSNAPTAQALIASNVFSARLLSSTLFEFGGRRYDLREMLGVGVTQLGTAAGVGITPPTQGYAAVVPFSGSAIRMGGH